MNLKLILAEYLNVLTEWLQFRFLELKMSQCRCMQSESLLAASVNRRTTNVWGTNKFQMNCTL